MKYVLLGLGALLLLILTFMVWRVIATIRGGRRAWAALLTRIAPVIGALQQGRDPSPEDLQRFAGDRVTRRVLYDTLDAAGKLDLFPAEWRTWPAMAEADLIVWLGHPNELAAAPDEIELMATVPAPGDAMPPQHYFVFRFRTHQPHWAASRGWTAGVSGPYDLTATPRPGARGTFSRFEAWDSRTPEEHVGLVHRQVAAPVAETPMGAGNQ